MEIMTFSRRRSFSLCPRRELYEYGYQLRRDTDSAPLRMGSAFHEALDLRKQGIGEDDAIEQATNHLWEQLQALGSDRRYDSEIEFGTVCAMLFCYFDRWEEMDKSLEYVATEIPFEVPVINPATGKAVRDYVLSGKIDAIVRLADGRLAVMEHKTSSEDLAPDADYWKRLRVNSQISYYFKVAEQLGYQVDTILYDVMRKPTIRPSHVPLLDDFGLKIVLDAQGNRVMTKQGKPRQTSSAEDNYVLQVRLETSQEFQDRVVAAYDAEPDRFFARREIPRLQDDIDDAMYDLYQDVIMHRENYRNNRFPRRDNACIGFGTCPFFNLCGNGIVPNADDVPAGYIKLETAHPELEAVTP